MARRGLEWGLVIVGAVLLGSCSSVARAGPGAAKIVFTEQGPIIPTSLIASYYNYRAVVQLARTTGDAEVKLYLSNIPGWNASMASRHIIESGLPTNTWILKDQMIIMMWNYVPPLPGAGWKYHAFSPPSWRPAGWSVFRASMPNGARYYITWPPSLTPSFLEPIGAAAALPTNGASTGFGHDASDVTGQRITASAQAGGSSGLTTGRSPAPAKVASSRSGGRSGR